MANIKKSFNFRSGVQVDDDNFVVNSNGLVGIGSTVPTTHLDVAGNIKTSGNVTGEQANFNTITATTLNIENVSTTGSVSGSGVKIGNPVGVVTAENVGETVTYYGDGQYLQNLPTSQWVDKDAGLGYISIYAAGNVGVSTDDPRHVFQVGGTNDINAFEKGVGINSEGGIVATGVVTATTFKGNVTGDITSSESTITQVKSTYAHNTGIVTTSDLHVTGIVTTPAIEGVTLASYPHGSVKTIVVTVDAKTSDHRYSGQGNANGYFIDGKESPVLSFTPGRTYRFDQSDSSNSSYPLRFYYDEAGTKPFTSGLNVSGTEGSAGAYTEITIREDSAQELYYLSASGATLVGNVIITNATAKINNLHSVGVITATQFDGDITGNVTSNTSTFTRVDTTNLEATGIGTISDLESDRSVIGIVTATKGHITDSLGVGVNNPTRAIEVYSAGISTVDIVGKENATISIGQNQTSLAGIGESTAKIRFGSQDKTFDIINGDLGDFNSYIHSGNFTGINTGGFNWIYGQTNAKLMTLSYKGHLGINKSDPEVQLDVVGHSTFTGSVRVIGDLEIDGGNLIGGNASLPAIIDASDINRPSGISTFGGIDVNDIIEVANGVAIGTARENIWSATALDAQRSIGLFSSVGIGTTFTHVDNTINGHVSVLPESNVGIGTTVATCALDFAFAGIPNMRHMKLPRVTTTERNNLVYLEPGSIIWNSTDGQIQYWNSGWNSLT
tara:strand:+ start:296 stop:2482 length:2187 start_codon:yes stop_codon:yes gene_type:complete